MNFRERIAALFRVTGSNHLSDLESRKPGPIFSLLPELFRYFYPE